MTNESHLWNSHWPPTLSTALDFRVYWCDRRVWEDWALVLYSSVKLLTSNYLNYLLDTGKNARECDCDNTDCDRTKSTTSVHSLANLDLGHKAGLCRGHPKGKRTKVCKYMSSTYILLTSAKCVPKTALLLTGSSSSQLTSPQYTYKQLCC